jgi:hypothetical protein
MGTPADSTGNTESGIAGTVTDLTGAIIPRATVTVSGPDARSSRTTVTDGSGHYRFPALMPGRYDLRAQAAGFETYTRKGIAIAAGDESIENLKLSVGAATQTVTVEAVAQSIEVETPGPDTRIDQIVAGPMQGVFEITTENGERWTSTDGATWQRK